MADTNEIVVFEDADGNEISNDPRWKASKLLADSGVDAESNAAAIQEQLDAKDAEIEALKAALAAQQVEDSLEDDDADEVEPDLDEAGARTYKELDGKALKNLAGERGVDISGLRKVGEVRAALVANDAK